MHMNALKDENITVPIFAVTPNIHQPYRIAFTVPKIVNETKPLRFGE